MSGFNPIELRWKGKPYTIPANSVLKAIASVEEVVTRRELCEMLATERPKAVLVSSAFAQLLRYAGVEITDEEAYVSILSEGATGQGQLEALALLITQLLPSSFVEKARKAQAEMDAGAGKGGTPKGKGSSKSDRRNGSSRPTTRASSPRNKGSRPNSSGGSLRAS